MREREGANAHERQRVDQDLDRLLGELQHGEQTGLESALQGPTFQPRVAEDLPCDADQRENQRARVHERQHEPEVDDNETRFGEQPAHGFARPPGFQSADQQPERQQQGAPDERHDQHPHRRIGRLDPERGNDAFDAEQAAEHHPERDRGYAARNQQPEYRHAPRQCQTGHEQNDALAHVAEHIAEQQRRDDRDEPARIGTGASRHAEQAAEKLERLHPAWIAQQQRRLRVRRRRREMQHRAGAGRIERRRDPRRVARPSGQARQDRTAVDRADLLEAPRRARHVREGALQPVPRVERGEIGAQRAGIPFAGRFTLRDQREVGVAVGAEPARDIDPAPLLGSGLFRERRHRLAGADGDDEPVVVDLRLAREQVRRQRDVDAGRAGTATHDEQRCLHARPDARQRAKIEFGRPESLDRRAPQRECGMLRLATLQLRNDRVGIRGPPVQHVERAHERGGGRLSVLRPALRRREVEGGPVGPQPRRELRKLAQLPGRLCHSGRQLDARRIPQRRLEFHRCGSRERLEREQHVVARRDELEPDGGLRPDHGVRPPERVAARRTISARSRSRSSATNAR